MKYNLLKTTMLRITNYMNKSILIDNINADLTNTTNWFV